MFFEGYFVRHFVGSQIAVKSARMILHAFNAQAPEDEITRQGHLPNYTAYSIKFAFARILNWTF